MPRPETEILVEKCISIFNDKACTIADIGCGSGAIVVAMAANLPNSHIYATDISDTALEVSAENSTKFNLNDKVTFIKGNLLEPFKALGIKFDAIVSNPPYIPSKDIPALEPEVSKYEPKEALDGGSDGLDIYKKLIPDAFDLLKDEGLVIVEIGIGEAEDVREIALNAGYGTVEIINDLAGIERIVAAFK